MVDIRSPKVMNIQLFKAIFRLVLKRYIHSAAVLQLEREKM